MATTATERFSTTARRPTAAHCDAPRRPGGARSAATAVGAVVLTCALIATGHYAGRQIEARAAVSADQSVPVYLPNAKFLRFASLGYENAVADILWFRTIDYFGRHYRSDRLYPWLARMCDIVTDLDPRAKHVYRFAGFILPWEAGRPDDGIALLEKGLRVFPNSWRFHFFAGFNYFFFKNDLKDAIRHIRRAAELSGANPAVSRLATLLYSKQYGLETTRKFLENLRSSAESPAVASVVADQLKQIQLAEDTRALKRAIHAYQEKFGKLPSSLDELVRKGLLARIPREPFGGSYTYNPATGAVGSTSGHRVLQLYTSEKRALILRGEEKARD